MISLKSAVYTTIRLYFRNKMGQSITCNCLENMELDPSSRGKAAIERLDVLKKGNKFTRNALLGRFLACILHSEDWIIAVTFKE